MLGLFFGTLCLFLLFGLVAAPRRHWAFAHAHGHGCHHGRHRHHHGFRGHHRGWRHEDAGPRPGFRPERFESRVHDRLRLDDLQREVVADAMRGARKAVHHYTDILSDSREELADAVRGEQLDQARLDAVFEKWDESLTEARKEVVDAVRKAHVVLDKNQRERLAAWITHARGPWSREEV